MREDEDFDIKLEAALERKKGIVIAGVVAIVNPRLDAVERRVERVEANTSDLKEDIRRVENGVAGVYPRLDDQDRRVDKRLDRMEDTLKSFGSDLKEVCESVSCLVKRNDRKDGASDARNQAVKVFLALICSGSVVGAVRWAWQNWIKMWIKMIQ